MEKEKEKALALQRELERAAREKERRELEEKRKALEEKRKLVRKPGDERASTWAVVPPEPGSSFKMDLFDFCVQEEQLRLAAEQKAAKEREAAKQAAAKQVSQRSVSPMSVMPTFARYHH